MTTGGPKQVSEQPPPSLYSQFADTEVTVFGMSGTIKDLEGLCPVPPEQRTPEAMERFTAKVLIQAGVEIPQEFSHLAEAEATEDQAKQAAQAEKIEPQEPNTAYASEPEADATPLAVKLEVPESIVETARPAKTIETTNVVETFVERSQPPSQQELAAVVAEHNQRLQQAANVEQQQSPTPIEMAEPIVEADKHEPNDQQSPEVAATQVTPIDIEAQPAPRPTMSKVEIPVPETQQPQQTEMLTIKAPEPYKPPVEIEFVQPVEATVSLEPEAQQLAEEIGLPAPIEAEEVEDDSWIDNIILANQIEANETSLVSVEALKPQEAIVTKIAETIELGPIAEEQSESLIRVLPPTIQESLIEYGEQVEKPEIIERLAIEIAPLAYRLNELVTDGQANSQEAIEIKQTLIEWYEELTDQLEINEDKSAVNNLITAICSPTYKQTKVDTDAPVNDILHERKYVHKPFDIKFAAKLTQVLQAIELEVAKLMIKKSLAA